MRSNHGPPNMWACPPLSWNVGQLAACQTSPKRNLPQEKVLGGNEGKLRESSIKCLAIKGFGEQDCSLVMKTFYHFNNKHI